MFIEACKSCLKFQLRQTRDDKLAEQEEKSMLNEKEPFFLTAQKELSPKKGKSRCKHFFNIFDIKVNIRANLKIHKHALV